MNGLWMAIELDRDLRSAAVIQAIGSLRNFAGVGAGAGRFPILIYNYYLHLTSLLSGHPDLATGVTHLIEESN